MSATPPVSHDDITKLLQKAESGDRAASEELFARVFPGLRLEAHRVMAEILGARPSDDATGLVSSAYQRLAERGRQFGINRKQFFYKFGRAMRDTVIDELRNDDAIRRGGRVARVRLSADAAEVNAPEVPYFELFDALKEFEQLDELAGAVIHHRYFVGLELQEIADLMEQPVHLIRNNLNYGRAWLLRRLSAPRTPPPGK